MEEAERQSRLKEKETATDSKTSWSVRPDEKKTEKTSKSKALAYVWFGIVVMWGCYVILSWVQLNDLIETFKNI